MSPLVSVVIPSYNNEAFVVGAVESVLGQTYKNIELIVVDDGSTDNTRSVMERYGERIRYIYQSNKGLSGARNTGIRNAGGNFVALLDADDIWLAGKLERQMNLLLDAPDVGMVGCGYYLVTEDLELISTNRGRNYASREDMRKELVFRNVIDGSGSGVVIRKECFEKVGFFDETFSTTEDRDMWFRILEHFNVMSVEDLLLIIRFRKNSLSKNTSAMKKNHRRFLGKHGKSVSHADRQRAYAYSYLDAARTYAIHGCRRLAFRDAMLSIISYPAQICEDDDKYFILIKSILPERVIGRIKRIRAL